MYYVLFYLMSLSTINHSYGHINTPDTKEYITKIYVYKEWLFIGSTMARIYVYKKNLGNYHFQQCLQCSHRGGESPIMREVHEIYAAHNKVYAGLYERVNIFNVDTLKLERTIEHNFGIVRLCSDERRLYALDWYLRLHICNDVAMGDMITCNTMDIIPFTRTISTYDHAIAYDPELRNIAISIPGYRPAIVSIRGREPELTVPLTAHLPSPSVTAISNSPVYVMQAINGDLVIRGYNSKRIECAIKFDYADCVACELLRNSISTVVIARMRKGTTVFYTYDKMAVSRKITVGYDARSACLDGAMLLTSNGREIHIYTIEQSRINHIGTILPSMHMTCITYCMHRLLHY